MNENPFVLIDRLAETHSLSVSEYQTLVLSETETLRTYAAQKADKIRRDIYGDSIYINTAEEISGIPASWPGYDLTIGSSGQKVQQLQEQLDAIATVYSAIPRVSTDGIYGPGTAESVSRFQSIFGLPQTGVVDFATWYKISHIYVGVSGIGELYG